MKKHGYSKLRTWRKLHLGVDSSTGFIYAHTLTDNKVDDGLQLELLFDQMEENVDKVSADGAYDMGKCWDALERINMSALIPP